MDDTRRAVEREGGLARLLVEDVRCGALGLDSLRVGAGLGLGAAREALTRLGHTVPPDALDAESRVEGLLGAGTQSDARIVLAALRPRIPALACWWPQHDWAGWVALADAWVAGDEAAAERLRVAAAPLLDVIDYDDDAPPVGWEGTQYPVEHLYEALAPQRVPTPALPPDPEVWARDVGSSSRFPATPVDAQDALALVVEGILEGGGVVFADALESCAREYGVRYINVCTQQAQVFGEAVRAQVFRAVVDAAYVAMEDAIRDELRAWCLGGRA